VPLAGRIEESFQRQLDALPGPARRLVQLAAADPSGDSALVWRAARQLGISPLAAVDPRLMEIGARVRFRHPLVRSAAYQSASATERRESHHALAQATDPQADPDRRAWHLAQATSGPDEDIAAELQRSAGRAQARGGMAAAAAFLDRSMQLTVDPVRRAERTLAAAQASLQAGAFDTALGLLATVEAGPLDEFASARADLLRAHVAFAAGPGRDAPPLLLKAARRLEPVNLGLARETYLDAWGAAIFAGSLADAGELLEISRAALALPPPSTPGPADLLLDGLARLITDGRAAAAPALRRAAGVFASADISVTDVLRWGWVTPAAAAVLWDDDGFRAILARQLAVVRAAGALDRLPIYLAAMGSAAAWSGDFATAAAVVAEAEAVSEATGTHIAPFGALLLTALRGDQAQAAPLIEATVSDAGAAGQGIAVAYARWAAAILANGLGRYADALAAAQQATEDRLDLDVSMWALPELIEAAARSGNPALAAGALKRLAETTQPGGTDFGLGIEARSRALLSTGDAAEGYYLEAIDRLGRTRLRPELARAHLLYGEWLRRENRRVDARAQLRTAYGMLAAMGAEAFAERARHELAATGETVRKRAVQAVSTLTPRLAAVGADRSVGQQGHPGGRVAAAVQRHEGAVAAQADGGPDADLRPRAEHLVGHLKRDGQDIGTGEERGEAQAGEEPDLARLDGLRAGVEADRGRRDEHFADGFALPGQAAGGVVGGHHLRPLGGWREDERKRGVRVQVTVVVDGDPVDRAGMKFRAGQDRAGVDDQHGPAAGRGRGEHEQVGEIQARVAARVFQVGRAEVVGHRCLLRWTAGMVTDRA